MLRRAYFLGCDGGKDSDGREEQSTASYPMQMVRGMLGYAGRKRPLDTPTVDPVEEEEHQARVQQLRLRAATSAREWKNAAERLDHLEGNHWWKFEEDSGECNLNMIRKRLDKLKRANHDGDIKQMLSLIRTSLARDLGGMCNLRLYQHTWHGTKSLIDEYTEVVSYTIDQLTKYCETAPEDELDTFLNELKSARQSFGNSALLLSGGGTLGMLHIGVVKCLIEQDVLPRIVCGSSAGSIVGSVLCCHKGRGVLEKLDELINGDLSVFQGKDEIQGVPGMAFNLLKGEPMFHVGNICRVMQSLLGNMTFKEAFNHTGRILNIHVSCRDRHNLPRLLNYQTAPNVVIWTAVASSCAVPWVFEAPGLLAKDLVTNTLGPWGHLDHKWIDGSIEGDLPAQIMERLFNVNNFIVSQVNPHVVPFMDREEDTPYGKPPVHGVLRKCLGVGVANAIWCLDGLMDRGWDSFPVKMAHSILSQRYDGDITITPDISWVSWLKVLANPTRDFMQEAMRQGEKATWPKLDRIRNHVAIELALTNGINHIQSIKIAPRLQTRNGRYRPSSIRSEKDLPRWRTRSGIESPAFVRPSRGRSQTHRPARSMVEANLLLTQTLTPTPATTTNNGNNNNTTSSVDNQQTSSSDERSGRSSPTTSYDDEDFDDVKRPSSSPAAHNVPTFSLSQPATPSIASKAFYFGPEASSPAATTRQPVGPAPDLRRVLNDLQMSSIDLRSVLPGRRRARK